MGAMRLEGKVAVITGGGSGIRAAGGVCSFVRTDVRVAADVERLVTTAVEAHGKLDCMFNNAGINLAGSVVEVSEAEWDRCIDTNLKSVFLGSKYALPHLVRNGGGVIVNDSSNAGLIGRPNDPVYCASKHGIIGLTKS